MIYKKILILYTNHLNYQISITYSKKNKISKNIIYRGIFSYVICYSYLNTIIDDLGV